jgi:hypothetical protein
LLGRDGREDQLLEVVDAEARRAFRTRVSRLLKTPSLPDVLTDRGPAVPSVQRVPLTSPSF